MINEMGVPDVYVVNVMDSNNKINEFELQSFYYIHFRTHTLGNVMNNPILIINWLNLYNYCPSKRLSLALNNPRRVICN